MTLLVADRLPSAELASASNVLFVGPSLGTTTALWEPARNLLSEDFTVVAWDLPGHGASPHADGPLTIADLAHAVVALADSLSVTRFAYAGTSMGGAIGLELARLSPERLTGAVVLCSAAKIGETEMWVNRAQQVRELGTASLVEATKSRWFAPAFLDASPAVVDHLLGTLGQANREDYAKLCEALGAFDARLSLGDIEVPILVISGSEDVVTPAAGGAVISTGVRDGRQVVITGAAHQAVVEKPAEVAAAIRDFLAGSTG